MKARQTNARLPKRVNNITKWYQLLSEFSRSDANQIELVPDHGEYKSIKVAQSVACTAIRRYGFNMRTVRVNDKLYLVKSLNGGDNNAVQE